MNLTSKLSYLENINREIIRIARKKNQTSDKFIEELGIIEECLDYDVKIPRTELPQVPQINIPAAQANLLDLYARNPILRDAIERRKTVKQSAMELGKINRTPLRLFPRAVNKEHNARLDYLEELIGAKAGLRTYGKLSIDNFLTVFSAASFLRSISVYAAIQNGNYQGSTVQDLAISVFAAPIIIGSVAIWMRGARLGIDEARYLDFKVQQFYR